MDVLKTGLQNNIQKKGSCPTFMGSGQSRKHEGSVRICRKTAEHRMLVNRQSFGFGIGFGMSQRP
jgi:hypothetical protein